MQKFLLACLSSSLVCMSLNVFALVELSPDQGNSISAEPYLKAYAMPSQQTIDEQLGHEKAQLDSQTDAPIKDTFSYPMNSDLSVGKVMKHRISDEHVIHECFFVMGDDGTSLKWFHDNRAYLKKIHALGIATNIDNQDDLSDLEKKTGFVFIPASMTGMQDLLGTNHYPFLWYQGWVLQ
jgi:integrating conjugative element protein (TIGR03765 family)